MKKPTHPLKINEKLLAKQTNVLIYRLKVFRKSIFMMIETTKHRKYLPAKKTNGEQKCLKPLI